MAKTSEGTKNRQSSDARPDPPDIRDRMYEPPLIQLPNVHTARALIAIPVLDQGEEGACTGFALASTINVLLAQRDTMEQVSPYMLYRMAQKHDEWEGQNYEGSSIRGALRGWHNMGACEAHLWNKRRKNINREVAINARKTRLGPYYRIQKDLTNFHAALNEVGVLIVSAYVHDGWDFPEGGSIKAPAAWEKEFAHAFAIVGYNAEGFLIQNSWGDTWGGNGRAIWSYDDWHDSLIDAWVVQLAARTPGAFHLTPSQPSSTDAESVETASKRRTARTDVAGHFVHIDDGKFHDHGKFWSNYDDVAVIANSIQESTKYEHVMFYAHGGLNSPKASARRIHAMRDGFKRNGIYPVHFMYDTGLLEEIKDIILGKRPPAEARAGRIAEWKDRWLERLSRRAGTAIWSEMKSGAAKAFLANGAGMRSLLRLLDAAAEHEVHLIGHSTGAVFFANALRALKANNVSVEFSTCSLYAPACTVELYKSAYKPTIGRRGGTRIADMALYNLVEEREQNDNVAKIYGKSLLYLVSNAFEKDQPTPILGMAKFEENLGKLPDGMKIHYSGDSRATESTSHGGFDNDPTTLNHTLARILGHRPRRPFTEEELKY